MVALRIFGGEEGKCWSLGSLLFSLGGGGICQRQIERNSTWKLLEHLGGNLSSKRSKDMIVRSNGTIVCVGKFKPPDFLHCNDDDDDDEEEEEEEERESPTLHFLPSSPQRSPPCIQSRMGRVRGGLATERKEGSEEELDGDIKFPYTKTEQRDKTTNSPELSSKLAQSAPILHKLSQQN